MDSTALDKLRDMLVRHESARTDLYDDENGVKIVPGYTLIGNPTVGVGRNLLGNPLSVDEIHYLLANDIQRTLKVAESQLTWFSNLDEVRQAAIADMIFNMGLSGFCTFVNTIQCLKNYQWEQAAKNIKASQWAGQVKEHRTNDIVRMITTGKW